MSANPVVDKVVKMCEEADPKRFADFLETSILLYAYAEKRFQERFPKEFNAWRDEEDRRMRRELDR